MFLTILPEHSSKLGYRFEELTVEMDRDKVVTQCIVKLTATNNQPLRVLEKRGRGRRG